MHLHSHRSSNPTRVPEQTFSGKVWISGYRRQPAPSRLVVAVVTFEPGAHTPWKTNPVGQTVVVTAGSGLARSENHGTVALEPGDVIWFPPGQRHWEGAVPEHPLTCVVLQEEAGEGVRFEDAVGEEDYLAGVAAIRTGAGEGGSA